ncbi:MAG: DUF1015 family protein [Oscillospiraceae bacterium]|jgi:uncharacterized protein (DUF1015 family)|nr:DUF1015 family protein [Oscillospiraceae bacterium]
MVDFRPFRALRPKPEYAAEVAALPYDVMNAAEAREMIKGKERSFLRIDKPETAFPEGQNPYAPEVYAKAKEIFEQRKSDGTYLQEKTPCAYIYRQIMDGRAQLGLVGTINVQDSIDGRVKKHEMTRADKETDRIRHVDTLNAQTGPIFLTYRKRPLLTETLNNWHLHHSPIYDFVSEQGVRQTVWVIDDPARLAEIRRELAQTESLYIADGHHRHASAVSVAQMRREAQGGRTGDEEFNYYLAVLFASDELKLMDYNRVIADLNGLTIPALLAKIEHKFTVRKAEPGERVRPRSAHSFGMCVRAAAKPQASSADTRTEWYHLRAKDGSFDPNDPVASLDVSILQNNLIAPILGINDPRTDSRIDFVGGIRGLGELERRAATDMRLAFAFYPASLDELMTIADAGEIMPPKSTWFEPKLLSGLFIHEL